MSLACTSPPDYIDPKTGRKRPYIPEKHRWCKARAEEDFIFEDFYNDYQEFISTSSIDQPPQIIVDYDNIGLGKIEKH